MIWGYPHDLGNLQMGIESSTQGISLLLGTFLSNRLTQKGDVLAWKIEFCHGKMVDWNLFTEYTPAIFFEYYRAMGKLSNTAQYCNWRQAGLKARSEWTVVLSIQFDSNISEPRNEHNTRLIVIHMFT